MKITNGDAVAMILRKTPTSTPEEIAKVLTEESPELAKWAARPFVNRRGPKAPPAAEIPEVDPRQLDLAPTTSARPSPEPSEPAL